MQDAIEVIPAVPGTRRQVNRFPELAHVVAIDIQI